MLVKTSQERIYDPPVTDDKHYLIFERYIPITHDPIKAEMLTQYSVDKPPGSKVGLSWVASKSFKVLSRPSTPESEEES